MQAKYLIAKINDIAANLGFADWGIASLAKAVSAEEQQRYLKRKNEQGFAQMGYLERNMNLRFNPQELVPGAKSIIVFLVPFGRNERIGNPAQISVTLNESLQDISNTIVPNGMFCASQFALGQDYHKVIKKKLKTIMSAVKDVEPEFEGRAFVDSAPVLERYWAVQAGLGFIGRNNFLISPKAGIRNFIGSIICNLKFPSNSLLPESTHTCGSCRKCIDACPSGALSAPFTIKASKCISYKTIEAPEAQATRDGMINSLINNIEQASSTQPQNHLSIFGCDRCMDACPWNRLNLPGWSEFEPEALPIPISHFHRR